MSSTMQEIDCVPVLNDGQWQTLATDRQGDVYNPSTGQIIATVPFCSAEQTGEIVEAAAKALPAWANTPVVDRARIMFRFHDLLEQNFDELAALATVPSG